MFGTPVMCSFGFSFIDTDCFKSNFPNPQLLRKKLERNKTQCVPPHVFTKKPSFLPVKRIAGLAPAPALPLPSHLDVP